MSLLNSVLGSLGSGNRTQLPKGPDRASTSTPPPKPANTTYTGTARPSVIPPTTKPKPQNGPSTTSQQVSLKRKPDGSLAQRNGPDKLSRPTPPLDRPRSTGPSGAGSSTKMAANTGAQTTASAPAKQPSKGSYMDLLNQAKALQAEKAAKAVGVGMIKHVAAPKDRMTKFERRRKEEQLRAQAKGKGGRVADNGGIKKPGQPANGKARAPEPPSYRGTARPPPGANGMKDKQAAEKTREESSYKGTAGMKKPPPNKKLGGRSQGPREDRYLDTDEEESDAGSFIVDDDEDEPSHHRSREVPRYRYAEDDEDDSDMEAGYSDVEDEEVLAERFAKKEDAKEKALEERLKREKELKRKAFERGGR